MSDFSGDELELRMRVADIAIRPFVGGAVVVPEEFGRLFDVLLERVKGSKSPLQGVHHCIEKVSRHSMMLAPVTTLLQPHGLGSMVLDKLHAVSVHQIGALCQWSAQALMDHARLTTRDIEIVTQALNGEGLSIGMSHAELRLWIEQGTTHAHQDG